MVCDYKNRAVNTPESPAFSVLKNSSDQSPYTDLEGNSVALTDYLGMTLVVTSWASWCPECALSLPKFSDIGKQYEGKGVKVLAINRSEPANIAVKFLESIKAGEGVVLVLDPDDRFYTSIGGYNMPETIFYDKEGNLTHHQRGKISTQEIQKYITEASSK